MDYDVVVIGAGIQGAGVAQAAAAAGHSVLLLEQYPEPAVGTSSRSSKLIHGGLRYLETFQFSLVRESLAERAILLKNAPDLVKLRSFHIPVYKETSRRPFKITLGLMLYSLFSFRPFKRVSEKDWGELDGLTTKNLQAVFKYMDASTDDMALTRAVVASAESLGAKVIFEASFQKAEVVDDDHGHCVVSYEDSSGAHTIKTRVLVNAAGPWIESVAKNIDSKAKRPAVDLVAGAHIEIPITLDQGMYYLEAEDNRAVFVMPWKGHALIGTTETVFEGDPAGVQPLDTEVDYLLRVYNHYFSEKIEKHQVLKAFSGLRVLPEGDGSAFVRPRGVVLVADHKSYPKVISIYGGKLTVYRKTAEDVMKLAKASLPRNVKRKADTRNLNLKSSVDRL